MHTCDNIATSVKMIRCDQSNRVFFFYLFFQLSNIILFPIHQLTGNVFWEAVSGGCVANTYMITDRPSDTALFIMEENSSCWMRCCCDPAQPALVKFYNVVFGGDRPEKKCCGILCSPARKMYNKQPGVGAVMTMEKPGMCSNFAQCGPTNCCVLLACCQSEAWMHTGDVGSVRSDKGCGPCKAAHWDFPTGEPGFLDKTTAFSHAQVPMFGGCFTPTVNIMARTNGVEDTTPWAVVEGPTFFGGCMDLCCTTKFAVSKTKGKSADIAMITKKAPEGGCGLCVALCTPADTYLLDFNLETKLSPQQKAAIIGEMVHLDFLFFEADQPICRTNNDDSVLFILCCTCYCMGALCPCECCIPLNKN